MNFWEIIKGIKKYTSAILYTENIWKYTKSKLTLIKCKQLRVLDPKNIQKINWRCTHINKDQQLNESDTENILKVYRFDTITINLKIILRQSRAINHAKIMFYEI